MKHSNTLYQQLFYIVYIMVDMCYLAEYHKCSTHSTFFHLNRNSVINRNFAVIKVTMSIKFAFL